MKTISVFGHRGFIGSCLLRRAQGAGHTARTFEREEIPDGELGHVFYAIGLTSDFRQRPWETVDAHVCHLNRILSRCHFESFCYLSSTRVYGRLAENITAEETATLPVLSTDPSDLYNLSKLMGESISLACSCENVFIMRLSNVFGPGMSEDCFLGSLLSAARKGGDLVIRQAPQSGKDYVSVDDVVEILLTSVSKKGRAVYNLASGRTTTHADIAARLVEHGVSVRFEPEAPEVKYPSISIARLERDFYRPRASVLSYLDTCLGRIRSTFPHEES